LASKQATTGQPTRCPNAFTGCPEFLQVPLYSYMIQPREKEGILKVMEGLGKVVRGWNEAKECLGPLQNSKPELGYSWICSTSLEKCCEMMKLVRVLVKKRNDHGWMKLG